MDDDLRQELDTHVALIEEEERRQNVSSQSQAAIHSHGLRCNALALHAAMTRPG
jgi:hypothetical protein